MAFLGRVRATATLCASLAVLLSLSALAPGDAAAQGVGTIQGIIKNGETGETLDYANVVLTDAVTGNVWGAMSLGGGRFYLRGVPAGQFELKVLYLGYKPITERVNLAAGQTLDFTFDLEVTVVKTFDVVDISGRSIMVEVKNTEFTQEIGSEDLTDYAVDTVEEAVARQAGVVARNGELHVRGGRSGEISFRIDGVAVDDPLGGSALSVGSFSVANVTTVTGGQDPEYGNALSGVVDVQTKEGNSERFEMRARFMTDDFGRQDRTFTNFDSFEFGLGGPAFSPKLTYFVSGQMRFSDQENYNKAFRSEHDLSLGDWTVAKWRRRQWNDVRASTKWAYSMTKSHKLTAEYTVGYTRSEQYAPNWDVQGYARQIVFLPVLREGSQLVFQGQHASVFHGDWVENIGRLATPRLVYDSTTGRTETLPVIEIRNVRGERVTAIAQPVFSGFRSDQSLFRTEPEDSSYVAFNAANNGPQNQRFTNQLKLVWTHTLTDDTFYELRLARAQFNQLTGVTEDGKIPAEYLHGGINSPTLFGTSRQIYSTTNDFYSDPDQPVFVTNSEWPLYRDQVSNAYNFKFDITSNRYEAHKLKSGVQLVYNDLADEFLFEPAREVVERFSGNIANGSGRSQFHTFNPEASFYLQDRWEYEGMVLQGGFRWDMFSPGSATEILIDSEDLDGNVLKYKNQFSPRLGFSFPITERDGFNFHYGRFVQFPARSVLFASQNPIGATGVLGNPNLEAETTVQYQAGVKHQFSDFVAMQFAVYNRDIYGLISATQATDTNTGQTINRYINRAYGNARGLEVTLERRFHNRWAFELAYSYAFADGVASSQEFGSNPDGLKFLPNQELPLNWDQRHTVAMDLRIQEPDSWAASMTFDYGSGFPWTPRFRFERRQDPLLENSRRLPPEYDLTLQAERHVNFYGRKLILYLQGHNLLNQDHLSSPVQAIFPGPIEATPDYMAYLTETGKFGGAYLQDVDGDTRDDFVPINDPRVFGQHRLFRVGVGWIF